MWMAAIVAPIQIFAGDEHGLNTLKHQPAKIMAMEGHFQSHPNGAPLILFGIPDQDAQKMRYSIEIPKASSLILLHNPNAPLAGLDTIPRKNQPPVAIVFWTFRIMVGIGFAMLGLGLWSLVARFRGKLYDWKWLHRAGVLMGPSGFVAVLAGWATTEVGRQPWTITGLLRTADASSAIGTPGMVGSLTAFVIVYFGAFSAGTWYILKLMAQPPHAGEPEGVAGPIRTAGTTPAMEGA
jgi:cytochrome bd ubiquinol oxidase subunit I